MFSYQAIAWPHAGQRERGVDSVIAGVSSWATPSRSALSIFQPRSSMSGRRWMTTFRKLPMQSPNRARTRGERKISWKGIGALHHLAQLEDRQVHREDDTPHQGPQDGEDERVQQPQPALDAP